MLAPFYFPVFRSLDLTDYDLIISSSSSFAKSVRKHPKAKHVCFCHNVTRFLWDTNAYLRQYSSYRKFYPVLERVFQAMRQVDLAYSQEPDLYIANSSVVARRIQQVYGKPSIVVNYPINSGKFTFSSQKADFYLASARLIGYKRMDVIIEAFNWLGLPLMVIGDGPERERLQAQALGNVQFLGYVSDEERTQLMARARAVVVAALEDYGLVPVEANASGTPVVAYGAGGVLDTQIPRQTGVLFKRQTPEALQAAILDANEIDWNYEKIRAHALDHFSEEAFFNKVQKVMAEVCH